MAPGDDHFTTEGAEIDILRCGGRLGVSYQFKVKADIRAVNLGLVHFHGNHIGSRQQGIRSERGVVDGVGSDLRAK